MITKFVAVLSLLALSLTACAPKSATVNPPSAPKGPNTAVLVALDSFEAACSVAAPLASGPVSAFLSGPCITSVSAIISIVEANGAAAKIADTIQALKTEAAALPPGTPDLQYANAALALATEVETIYKQMTAQTAAVVPAGASQLFATSKPAVQKIKWTADDKRRIAAMKKRLKK